MSERKGPRPVAWEGWHAVITGEPPRGDSPGFVDVVEYEGDDLGRDYTMTPDESETHGHALGNAVVPQCAEVVGRRLLEIAGV